MRSFVSVETALRIAENPQCKLLFESTVLMGKIKAISLKVHYFHILTSPPGRKFHASDYKTVLKNVRTISEVHEVLIELSGKMIIQTFKIVWGKLA